MARVLAGADDRYSVRSAPDWRTLLLLIWLTRLSATYAVTSQRAIVRRSLIARRTSEVELDEPFGREDRELTRRLIEAGGILGIAVLDHVILGAPGFVSLRAQDWPE